MLIHVIFIENNQGALFLSSLTWKWDGGAVAMAAFLALEQRLLPAGFLLTPPSQTHCGDDGVQVPMNALYCGRGQRGRCWSTAVSPVETLPLPTSWRLPFISQPVSHMGVWRSSRPLRPSPGWSTLTPRDQAHSNRLLALGPSSGICPAPYCFFCALISLFPICSYVSLATLWPSWLCF